MTEKRKFTDTSNVNLQQKLLSSQTLLIITTTNDPRIPDRVVTCGGTPHALRIPTTKGVIADRTRNSARVLQTHGHVSRTGRDVTTPHDGNVAVRNPQDNRTVLIAGIVVPSTMGYSGSQNVLKKRQSTSPSVRMNAQKFDASVDVNLANDGDSTEIFSKVLGR